MPNRLAGESSPLGGRVKNAVIVMLAVALAASIAVGVIAQASRTVNVEVRVWQDAREPGALWLSARAEGGSWADVGTAPVALDGLSGTGRYRYGDIAFALVAPPPASCEEASLAGDCATLLAARDELAGAGVLNWRAGVALADWDGVAVSGTPRRVTGLDLSDRGLSGSIPTELGNLAALRTLALSGNALTGCVPNALHEVATNDIERLNFGYCPGTLMTGAALTSGVYYQFPNTKVIIKIPVSAYSLYWVGLITTDGSGPLYCLSNQTKRETLYLSTICFDLRGNSHQNIRMGSGSSSTRHSDRLGEIFTQIDASVRLAQ